MLRPNQSPSSTPDCGPQCDQIPNFASRNQSGTRYASSEARVALNGPGEMGSVGAWPNMPLVCAPATEQPSNRIMSRRVNRIQNCASFLLVDQNFASRTKQQCVLVISMPDIIINPGHWQAGISNLG